MKKVALIVAAGAGKRMQNATPKQFLLLSGQPILMHTIRVFYNADPNTKIIVIINENDIEHWRALCQAHHFELPHTLINGGAERFFSVQNGINHLKNDEPSHTLVAIHDGVRPLATTDFINQCFDAAKTHQTAVPTLPLKDSIRNIITHQTTDRAQYNLVQTPQVFTLNILQKAYLQPFLPTFTDDASVVETVYPKPIHTVQGTEQNIKITTPFDLLFAEFILTKSPTN
jgi:2-C-methyl-D-erythritol 4-phosphate cytidylyltransferase